MKTYNFSKLLFTISAFTVLLVFSQHSFSQITKCTNTGSSTSNRITESSSDCYTQPDIQQVTFYKIALCQSQPTAPTTSTPTDLKSCTTVFQNSNGSTVNIQKGVTNNLVGQFNKPKNGNYSYLYLEIAPILKQQKIAYFSGSRTNTDGSSSGTKCWSLPANTYSYGSGSSAVATKCGSDDASTSDVGLTTTYINSLQGRFGFVNNYTFPTTAGPNLYAYIVDSSDKLLAAGSANTAPPPGTKVTAYMQQNAVIDKENRLSLINIFYNNSYGTDISMGGGSVGFFSGGPFDPYLTFKNE